MHITFLLNCILFLKINYGTMDAFVCYAIRYYLKSGRIMFILYLLPICSQQNDAYVSSEWMKNEKFPLECRE